MNEATDTTSRGSARAAKPQFGFFGEWVLHLMLATAVITAIVDGVAGLGGATIV